jgi:hypothetical protein
MFLYKFNCDGTRFRVEHLRKGFKVFTAVAIFFWVKSPRGLVAKASVSEKRAVSIFRVEVMSRPTNHKS